MQLEQIRLPDGYNATVRWWRVPQPRGAILYFHGIQSHGGWFETSGKTLAEAGFSVLMPDRRGSGANALARGHFDSVEQCEADSKRLLDVLRKDSGQDAVHLVGVSWGAKQVMLLAAKYPALVRTISLVAPGFFPRFVLDRAERFRIGLKIMNDSAAYINIPLNDASCLTGNPERASFVERDPLKLDRVTGSFLRVGRQLDRKAAIVASDSHKRSVHLLLAGRDQIIDNEKTRRWLRSLPGNDLQITEFPDGSHTLEFDDDAEAYFESLTGWLTKHC